MHQAFDILTWSILIFIILMCIIYIVRDYYRESFNENNIEFGEQKLTNKPELNLSLTDLKIKKMLRLKGHTLKLTNKDIIPTLKSNNGALVIQNNEGMHVKGKVGIRGRLVTPSMTIAQQILLSPNNGLQLRMGLPGTIELGYGDREKDQNAGKIIYNGFSSKALDIVGAGKRGGDRKTTIWDSAHMNKLCIGNTCITEQHLKDIRGIKQISDDANVDLQSFSDFKNKLDSTNKLLYHEKPKRPGLYYKLYMDGYFGEDTEWFISRIPSSAGYATDFKTLATITTNKVSRNDVREFSIEFFGFIIPDQRGKWTFKTLSDDASYVWVGEKALQGASTKDNAIVKNSGIHGLKAEFGIVELEANKYYPLRIQYGNNLWIGDFSFTYTSPNGTIYDTAEKFLFSS